MSIHANEATESRDRIEALYRTFAPDVYAYAARRVGREQADDVVSDVFAVAWRKIDRVPTHALPWLLAVARRTIANHLRGARRRDALRAELVAQSVAIPHEHPAEGSRALAALSELSARDQEALLLTAWEGLSAAQASTVLGCSQVAFRVRLHRARTRLARLVDRSEQAAEPQPFRRAPALRLTDPTTRGDAR